jgi:hypothetical protein
LKPADGSGAGTEGTGVFVPRPGTPAARPEVQSARDQVLAARAAMSGEISRLETSGRDMVDVRKRVKRIPSNLAKDPRKAAGVALAGVGAALGVVALARRGGDKPKRGALPAEVEEALAGLGKDGKKVRQALDASFARYLEREGVAEPVQRGRGLPPGLAPLLKPVLAAAVTEAIRRGVSSAASRRQSSTEDVGPPPDATAVDATTVTPQG